MSTELQSALAAVLVAITNLIYVEIRRREARRAVDDTRRRLHDVQRKVGAANRAEDAPEAEASVVLEESPKSRGRE